MLNFKISIYLICALQLANASKLTEINKSKSSDSRDIFYEDDRFLQTEYFGSSEYWHESGEYKDVLKNIRDPDWDVLIFTQQWPVTTCLHWREHDHNHPCRLPTVKEFWTIHGIWPTKYGHFGPSFCNGTATFNMTQLAPIMDELNFYWPDLAGGGEADKAWFWRHEYLKHGTCAAQLPTLDTEFKYFNKALELRESLLISDMLDVAGIHPDSTNTVIAINDALVKFLGANPAIHCISDPDNNRNYLSEVRICLDKSFNFVDCNGIKSNGGAVTVNYPGGQVNTNCHISSPVYYPSVVPPTNIKNLRANQQAYKFPYVNIYKLIRFIEWCTR